MPDLSSLCDAVLERCDQASRLEGGERQLYLLDAVNKLQAMVELYLRESAKAKVRARKGLR